MKQQSKEKMYQISNEEILGNYIRTQDKKERNEAESEGRWIPEVEKTNKIKTGSCMLLVWYNITVKGHGEGENISLNLISPENKLCFYQLNTANIKQNYIASTEKK